jgi:hypothetical protein
MRIAACDISPGRAKSDARRGNRRAVGTQPRVDSGFGRVLPCRARTRIEPLRALLARCARGADQTIPEQAIGAAVLEELFTCL